MSSDEHHLSASTDDPLALLRGCHRRILALLDDYALLVAGDGSVADRTALIGRLGNQLRAHTRVEAELFYPALGDAPEMLRQAHADYDSLVAQIEGLAARTPGAAGVDQQVAALGKAVRAHVALEEQRLFPLAAGVDRQALGPRMAVRLAQLLGEQGPD